MNKLNILIVEGNNPEDNEAYENLIKLLTFYKPKKTNSNSIVIAIMCYLLYNRHGLRSNPGYI